MSARKQLALRLPVSDCER